MPKLVIATGVAQSPTLAIADVEPDDYDWWVTFYSGKFRVWVRQEKSGSRYSKMSYVALKCDLNNKQVVKIEKAKNAQGDADEKNYSYPELPPVEPRDPLRFLYSTYNVELNYQQLGVDPCTVAAIARYKLLLNNGRSLSEVTANQSFATPQGQKPLDQFLLDNHCYTVDQTDRRVEYSVKPQSVNQTNQCVYGTAQTFKAPVAGLVGVENKDDFRLLNVAIARW